MMFVLSLTIILTLLLTKKNYAMSTQKVIVLFDYCNLNVQDYSKVWEAVTKQKNDCLVIPLPTEKNCIDFKNMQYAKLPTDTDYIYYVCTVEFVRSTNSYHVFYSHQKKLKNVIKPIKYPLSQFNRTYLDD